MNKKGEFAMIKGELFKGIIQWDFRLPDKKLKKDKFKLPVFYYDNTSFTAIYTASTKKVRAYLPRADMHPAEFLPGRCLVAFTAFEYRETDIDPYNEFSISVPMTLGKRGVPGLTVMSQMMKRCYEAYVWHLPVTTERARYGGVELYGYPKFIARIEITKGRNKIECVLSEKKTAILTLSGPVLPVSAGKITRYKTYPVKDGVVLCGNVYINPLKHAETRKTKGVELVIGRDHPIGRELLGINLSAKPVMYQYSPLTEAILFGPRHLIDD
jgi:hypothetical protein